MRGWGLRSFSGLGIIWLSMGFMLIGAVSVWCWRKGDYTIGHSRSSILGLLGRNSAAPKNNLTPLNNLNNKRINKIIKTSKIPLSPHISTRSFKRTKKISYRMSKGYSKLIIKVLN
jgi:hypothetical protein